MSVEYAIIIKNKTRLETLIERFNTKQQAKFYIERSGGKFEDYEIEHETFVNSLSLVQRQLSKTIKNKIVERSFLPSFLFNEKQVAIVIGQDGLVANAAKYVNGIPIIAINPDVERYDGILLPFTPNDFGIGIENVIQNKFKQRSTFFAEAKLNDGQRLLAFNDLFIGAATHVSARYRIGYQDQVEEHSSSGVIVSTQAGSTGWLSSIFNMTSGMQRFIEKGNSKRKFAKLRDNQLLFVVREPFASRKTQIDIQAGIVTNQTILTIESLMPSNGIIFSDGIEADFLKFNSGSIATIRIAKEKANLVVK
jgi:NAD kinase